MAANAVMRAPVTVWLLKVVIGLPMWLTVSTPAVANTGAVSGVSVAIPTVGVRVLKFGLMAAAMPLWCSGVRSHSTTFVTPPEVISILMAVAAVRGAQRSGLMAVGVKS